MQPRLWHNSYPPGMPVELPIETHLTVTDLLVRAAARFADRPAFSSDGTMLDFRRLDILARAFAAHLQAAGLEPGDRLAIMLPNRLPYPVALFGGFLAGLVVVNVNPLYTARELAHQLRDCGARAILVLDALLPVLAQVSGETGVEIMLSVRSETLAAANAKGDWCPEAGVEPAMPGGGLTDFAGALADGLGRTLAAAPRRPGDAAFLQYTGGTTGVSKGAILTHANMVANLGQQATWFAQVLPEGEAVIITPLPLYHVYPMAVMQIGMMRGCLNRLIANPRDPAQVLAAMRQGAFDMFLGINTLLVGLLATPEFAAVRFKPSCYVVAAGAPVQEAVAGRWKNATGVCINEAYGLTEASPCVTLNPTGLADWTQRIGLPVPGTDVRLVNGHGQDVPLGEPGELLVKGPQVFAGYWERPDETAKVLSRDGWLSTGDIAVMDGRGYLSLVDRKKDMILVSGFNVYPNEIEAVVTMLDDVLECACIGVPDERSGEAPHLYVVAARADLTRADVEQHCRANLTGYKVPRHITFVTSLPKSTVGKILRRELRESSARTATTA